MDSGKQTTRRRVMEPAVRRGYILLLLLVMLGGSRLQAQSDLTSTPEPEPMAITFWLPDLLVPPDSPDLLTIVQSQTEAFNAAHPEYHVTIRLKQIGITGGIMSTLRTASAVAPAALPTLTLLRRQDLLVAERDGLIQSIEGLVPSALLGDFANALRLGQINNMMYGVPYVLEMQHLVYRVRPEIDYSSWGYDAFLQRSQPFAFAATRSTGLNDVFLAQYLAAGGSLDTNGALLFNEDALKKTYEFYEQIYDNGLLYPDTATYQSPDEYVNAFRSGDIGVAVFDSGMYLRLREQDNDLAIAPLPTTDGTALSLLNGWMWVVVTTNPDARTAALRYITWMTETERLAAYTRMAYRLPARRSALLEPLAGDNDGTPFLDLIEQAVLPITESDGGTLARLMQEGLISVLNGSRTAEQAVDFILSQQPR